MLGMRTQLRLADFIKAIADTETAVEMTRQVLAEKKGFHLKSAFNHIDVTNRKYLTTSDLINFLNELDLFPTEEEVSNLINCYSSSEEAKLSYKDFERLVLSATNSNLRKLVASSETQKPQALTYTSAWALARVLDKEISGSRKVEILRESLLELDDWDLTEAFLLVDTKGQGFLNTSNILQFLKFNEITASYEDAVSFMRRADRDEDGKVSHREFARLFLPGFKTQKTLSSPRNLKKSNYKYAASPSPKKSNGLSRKANASKSPSQKTPVKSNQHQEPPKYKNHTPKRQLSDNDYTHYLGSYTKSENPEKASLYRNVDQEKSQNLWPAESNSELIKKSSVYRNRTPQKVRADSPHESKTARQKSIETKEQRPEKPYALFKSSLLPKKEDYIPSKLNFTPRQDRHSPKQDRRSPKQDRRSPKLDRSPIKQVRSPIKQDRRSPKIERSSPVRHERVQFKETTHHMPRQDRNTPSRGNAARNEYDISVHTRDTATPSEYTRKERPTSYRHNRESTRELRNESYSKYRVDRSDIKRPNENESKENYDFSGYRATLGRKSPEPENQKSANKEGSHTKKEEVVSFDVKVSRWNENSYNTPRKEKPELQAAHDDASQKKLPSEFVISPQKLRSPGRYLGAKTLSQKPTIKGYEEQFLIKVINTVMECERDLQILKKDLAIQKDFTIIAAFRKFVNKDAQNATNQRLFEENLKTFRIFLTKIEAETVFSKFDNDSDGVISLKDFEHMVLPTEKDHAVQLRERDVTEDLGDRSVKMFVNFIKKFAEVESKLEDLRVRISKRFSLEDAFKAIDTKEKGFIDSEELKEILVYHGVFPTAKDIQNVINKIDTDNDGKLSFREFQKGFSPQKALNNNTEGATETRYDYREKEDTAGYREDNEKVIKVERAQNYQPVVQSEDENTNHEQTFANDAKQSQKINEDDSQVQHSNNEVQEEHTANE